MNPKQRWFKPMPRVPAAAKATVVIVADAGRARVLTAAAEDSALIETDDLLQPDARLTAQQLTAGRHGHVTGGAGHAGARAGGHSFTAHHSPAEASADEFADVVCDYLDFMRDVGRLEKLYLIAPPDFLGLLRHKLGRSTRALIAQELALDLTRHPLDAIRAALPVRL
jgi:protein required for attachment to host cells